MEKIIRKILLDTHISFNSIHKATSGFTNLVYFIDDSFVIKISQDDTIKKKLDKEISVYKNIFLDCIPKYIASGEIETYKYLIISRVRGNSLYSIWHTLSNEERYECIKKIAIILKKFNRQNYNFLNNEYKMINWCEFISNELKSKVNILNKMGFDTSYINNYILHELPLILSQNNYGLVYNDAHFDNFIYYNGSLYLIDFDRVKACPVDFEMLIFKTMCDNPSKFASEKDECNIKDEDYGDIYTIFRNEYSEMFDIPHIEQRIYIYQFNYLIGQAINNRNVEWINQLLIDFNIQINKASNT